MNRHTDSHWSQICTCSSVRGSKIKCTHARTNSNPYNAFLGQRWNGSNRRAQTDTQTDGRTPPSALSPNFAVYNDEQSWFFLHFSMLMLLWYAILAKWPQINVIICKNDKPKTMLASGCVGFHQNTSNTETHTKSQFIDTQAESMIPIE